MGINMVAGISGQFIGLVLGGVLADINWRLVFWVNVPFGLFGTAWAYLKLREIGHKVDARLDWVGNVTFAAGLIAMLVGITYAIQPYKTHTMAWTRPLVLVCLLGGAALLAAFVAVERRVADPMFDLSLFSIRAFTAGNGASLLSSIGRGGMTFMLIIWLQGIWLPLHGYSFESTPLWAGIYMLPLTAGFLFAGPVSGWLSDRYGARAFGTSGMALAAATFVALMLLPADFNYGVFALLILLNGIGFGLFAAPNTTAIMNAVPARQRGAASGMRATFQNSGMVLSIGLFFSLMIVGLSSSLPSTMRTSLQAQGMQPRVAAQVASAPPVGSLFAAFLGYNPMQKLVPQETLQSLPSKDASTITGKRFFPELISGPFTKGVKIAFSASALMCLVAAGASFLRGARYVHEDGDARELVAA
jgi:MFS family permease